MDLLEIRFKIKELIMKNLVKELSYENKVITITKVDGFVETIKAPKTESKMIDFSIDSMLKSFRVTIEDNLKKGAEFTELKVELRKYFKTFNFIVKNNEQLKFKGITSRGRVEKTYIIVGSTILQVINASKLVTFLINGQPSNNCKVFKHLNMNLTPYKWNSSYFGELI